MVGHHPLPLPQGLEANPTPTRRSLAPRGQGFPHRGTQMREGQHASLRQRDPRGQSAFSTHVLKLGQSRSTHPTHTRLRSASVAHTHRCAVVQNEGSPLQSIPRLHRLRMVEASARRLRKTGVAQTATPATPARLSSSRRESVLSSKGRFLPASTDVSTCPTTSLD